MSDKGNPEPLTLDEMYCYGGLWRSFPLELAKGMAMDLVKLSPKRPGTGYDAVGEWSWIRRDLPISLIPFVDQPSEEEIKELAESHIPWIEITFSIGMGLKAEKPFQERQRQSIELFHRHRIKVLAYMSLTSMFATRFLKDCPEAESWKQIDSKGNPIHYFGFPERYNCCLNNPNWLNHQKQVIARAIDFGADGMSIDNIFFKCHCDICQKEFKAFCEEKHGKRGKLSIPHEVDWTNPLWRAYFEFQCDTVANAYKQLRDHAKQLKPSFIMTYNAHFPRENLQKYGLFQVPQMDRFVDFIFSEDGVFPAFVNGNRMDNIEFYKYGLAVGEGRLFLFHTHHNKVFPPNLLRLTIAESFAFNSAVSFLIPPRYPLPYVNERESTLKVAKQYYSFLKDNIQYYVNTQPLADVAMLYSHPTFFWYLHHQVVPPQYTHMRGFSKVLADSHIPFDYILDQQLSAQTLQNYATLILPNTACLSDTHAQIIEDYVAGGGGLVATAETSLYDENFTIRKDYGLNALFGVHRGEKPDKKSLRRQIGKGRAVYFPGNPDSEYLLHANNTPKALTDAVLWTMQAEPFIQTEAPKSVLVVPYEQNDDLILHYVNYARDEKADLPIPQRNIKVSLSGQQPSNTKCLTPDEITPTVKIDQSKSEQKIQMTLSELRIYATTIMEDLF